MSKILMIAPTPFFADRGCHTQIYEQIHALQKRGHEVLLCTFGLGREVEGITTRRCTRLFWYHKLSAGPSWTHIPMAILLLWTTLKAMASFKPDVVHCHLHLGALIGRCVQFVYRKPRYIFDLQGLGCEEMIQHRFIRRGSLLHRFFYWGESHVVKWFTVITQSKAMQRDLYLQFGVKAYNVGDGVDCDRFRPSEAYWTDSVGYCGVLEEYQGVDIMLEAFRLVNRARPGVEFRVIGYPIKDKYAKYVDEIPIQFLGKVNYFELEQYMRLWNVAVAPKIALTEGDGKLYNYLALGLPVVTIDRETSREIAGEAAVYVKPTPEAIASGILGILADDKLAASLRHDARARATHCLSWENVVKKIEKAYDVNV